MVQNGWGFYRNQMYICKERHGGNRIQENVCDMFQNIWNFSWNNNAQFFFHDLLLEQLNLRFIFLNNLYIFLNFIILTLFSSFFLSLQIQCFLVVLEASSYRSIFRLSAFTFRQSIWKERERAFLPLSNSFSFFSYSLLYFPLFSYAISLFLSKEFQLCLEERDSAHLGQVITLFQRKYRYRSILSIFVH